jgi:hypothetical protein
MNSLILIHKYQFVYVVFFAGEWLYKLLMHQACVFENKELYNKSNQILSTLISDAFLLRTVNQVLKDAIEAFQVKLLVKESYLANWVRKQIHNSYNAMTTSPVESVNCHIKHRIKASTLNNTSCSLLMMLDGEFVYLLFTRIRLYYFVCTYLFIQLRINDLV